MACSKAILVNPKPVGESGGKTFEPLFTSLSHNLLLLQLILIRNQGSVEAQAGNKRFVMEGGIIYFDTGIGK
ncbi:hypothetical protein [Effusibacillus consociatus]|uniref:hypothetical protein n=1 Tax=Effusibacillus consociatus TaxID=1117041 RepID=UPI0036D3AB06